MEPSPHLSQRDRALSFRAVASPRSLRERPRVRVQKKKRATILTFAAIPRQFLKPAPTLAVVRFNAAAEVHSPPFSPYATTIGSAALP